MPNLESLYCTQLQNQLTNCQPNKHAIIYLDAMNRSVNGFIFVTVTPCAFYQWPKCGLPK